MLRYTKNFDEKTILVTTTFGNFDIYSYSQRADVKSKKIVEDGDRTFAGW